MDLTKTAREITRLMLPYLTTQQNRQLKKVLSHCLFDENQLAENSGDSDNKSFLDLFLSAKRLEGCSDRTVAYYEATINKLLESFDTPACDLGTEEIRSYLSDYQQKAGVSRVTVDNVRRIISSFYSWLEDEDHIIKSPVRRIKRVKAPQPIKETYSDEVVEILCDNCGSPRNLALIDLLRSTGMRVGELVSLDRSSVDTINRECIVHGKGNKDASSILTQRLKSISRITCQPEWTARKHSSCRARRHTRGYKLAASRRCLENWGASLI